MKKAFLVPLRGIHVFPGTLRVVQVGRPSSIAAVRAHLDHPRQPLVLVPQLDTDEADATRARLLKVGVEATVLQVTELPDGELKILVEGERRVTLEGTQEVEKDATVGRIGEFQEARTVRLDLLAYGAQLARMYEEIMLGGGVSDEDHTVLTESASKPRRLADQVASVLELSWEDRCEFLAQPDPLQRMQFLIDQLVIQSTRMNLDAELQSKVQAAMDKSQREYHIKEQMKALRIELGDSAGPEAEADEFETRIKAVGMTEEAEKEALREVERLRRIPSDSAEYNISRTWLETLCDYPWAKATKDDVRMDHAVATLDEDHYGLHKVKDRILEYLAIRKLKPDAKGAILCFVGAPGVGKTSLGRSIATALGRTFARVSLGGVKDESEIRGHRRTYIGALPGRIIRAINRAGTNNPVIVLDEMDKVGSDFRGDPASALLEVLDPEQNHRFSDHYMDVPVDLSQVLFIATANQLDTIPSALLDRFEVIELPGYTEEEKLTIARRFLMPRIAEETGLALEQIQLSKAALEAMIRGYTREAGLRNLQRQLAAVFRKVARQVVEGRSKPARITPATVEKLLGPAPFTTEMDDRDEQPGVVIGLAWTASGGDILFIESLAMPGKGALKLTGSLGAVMKESAEAAMSWLMANAASYGLTDDDFKRNFHLHVPAGAIPKDGPSAGVSMVTALASRITNRPLKPRLAMTGELTLRGKVLPVGGIKEKVLAARRAGVQTVLLPKENAKDLVELAPEVSRDVEVILVETVPDVLRIALGLVPEAPQA